MTTQLNSLSRLEDKLKRHDNGGYLDRTMWVELTRALIGGGGGGVHSYIRVPANFISLEKLIVFAVSEL